MTSPSDVRLTPEQLTELFQQIETELVDNGGEETPELAEQMAQLSLGEKDMVDRYASFIRHLEARAEGLKTEAERYTIPLTAKASASLGLASRLKARLLEHMREIDQVELKGSLYKVRRQKSPEALALTDAGKTYQWPVGFWKTPALDTLAVKEEAKKQGGEIRDGDVLLAALTRHEHVRIY